MQLQSGIALERSAPVEFEAVGNEAPSVHRDNGRRDRRLAHGWLKVGSRLAHGWPPQMKVGDSGMHEDSVVTNESGKAPVRSTSSARTGDQPDSGAAMTSSRAASATHDPALARFYMTSDLRAATNLTRTHLDFYLREGVIVPTARTESGYLLFDDGELATLRQVIAWRQDGIGIREIRVRLNRGGEGEEGTNGDR